MLTKTGASAGLVAIAATAGTLLTFSPASAQTGTATAQTGVARVQAVATTPRGDGDGWWWWSSFDRFPMHRHHFCRDGFCEHRFFRDFDDFGYGGFGVNRNVNVLSNDVSVGISNSNSNVAVNGG